MSDIDIKVGQYVVANESHAGFITKNKRYKILDILFHYEIKIHIIGDDGASCDIFLSRFKKSNNFKTKIKFVKELL